MICEPYLFNSIILGCPRNHPRIIPLRLAQYAASSFSSFKFFGWKLSDFIHSTFSPRTFWLSLSLNENLPLIVFSRNFPFMWKHFFFSRRMHFILRRFNKKVGEKGDWLPLHIHEKTARAVLHTYFSFYDRNLGMWICHQILLFVQKIFTMRPNSNWKPLEMFQSVGTQWAAWTGQCSTWCSLEQ